MKRLLVVLLVLGLGAGTILAQDKTEKKETPKQEVKKEKCDMTGGCCCCKKEGKEMKCDMKKKSSDSKTETQKEAPKK